MKELKIALDSDKQNGHYSNLMKIYHTKEEFILDFLANYQETEMLATRVIVTPHHLKRMITALEESLKKYEEEHGGVTAADAPKPPVGFDIG
jgi:hypothetical protein